MERWEYKLLSQTWYHGESVDDCVRRLNEAGEQGWEIIGPTTFELNGNLNVRGSWLLAKKRK